jgi:hypothetical protein
MKKPASLVLGVALCSLLGVDASAALPTTRSVTPSKARPAPTDRTAQKVVLQKIQRPLTRKQLRPTKHKEASAVLADLLVRIADGKGSTKMERKIAKRLARSPARREVIQRLAKRWRAAPEDQLRKTIGRVDLGIKPQKATLDVAVSKASPTLAWLLRDTIPLPPENIPKPSKYQLELTGVQTIAAHDADGSDELSTLTIFATPSGKDYTLVAVKEPNDGTFAAPGAAVTSVGKMLFDDGPKDVLVITALVEDEGGNAAASRAEIEAMVDLAVGVAATLDGADRLAVLEAMIDYTFGLDALDGGPLAASRSIASVKIAFADWYALWGVDPDDYGGVKAKLVVPHTMGSGQYELMLNVPSVLPPMRTVLVAVDKFWLDSYPPLQQFWRPWELRLTTTVNNTSHTIALDKDVLSKSWLATYERKVLAGEVELHFAGTVRFLLEVPDNHPLHNENLVEHCETYHYQPQQCWEYISVKDMDIAPGDKVNRSATYSTETNKIVGLKGRTDLNKLTSKGNEDFIGGIKIRVTDVAPAPE